MKKLDEIEKLVKASRTGTAFDKKRANDGLKFLAKCDEITWVRIDLNNMKKESAEMDQSMKDIIGNIGHAIGQCYEELKKYLKNYNDFMQNEILQRLEDLSNLKSNYVSYEDMNEDAIEVSRLLKELETIESKYFAIKIVFAESDNNNIEKWRHFVCEILSRFQSDLGNLKNGSRFTDLQMGLSRVDALTKVDWLLNLKQNKNDDTFLKLYLGYQEQFKDNSGEKKISAGIQNNNFFEIGQAMTKLQNAMKALKGTQEGTIAKSIYDSSATLINRKLDQLLTDIKNQTIKLKHEIDLNQIETLKNDFRYIKDAELYCFPHLKDKGVALTKLKNESTQELENWMKKVASNLSHSIEMRQFEDVENRIETICTMASLLNTLTTKIEGLDSIDNKIKDKCDKLKTNYTSDIKWDDCKYNPYAACPLSELYSDLKPVLKKRTHYRRLWDDVNDYLLKKFRDTLDKAKQSTQKDATQLRFLCNSVVKSLPRDGETTTRSMLADELKQCENDIDERQAREAKLIKQFMKHNNYTKLVRKWYDEYKENNVDTVCAIEIIIRNKLYKLNDDICTKLEKKPNKDNATEMNEIRQKMCHIVQIWDDQMQVIKRKHSKTEDDDSFNERDEFVAFLLQTGINCDKKMIDKCVSLYNNVSFPPTTQDSIKELKNVFEFVDTVITAVKNVETNKIQVSNILDAQKLLQSKMKEYFVNIKLKFDSITDMLMTNDNTSNVNIDFTLIEDSIGQLKMFNNHEIMLKLLGIDWNQIISYQGCIDHTRKALNHYRDSIINQQLNNQQTRRNMKQQKEFLDKLAFKLNQLILLNDNFKTLCNNDLKVNVEKEYLKPIFVTINTQTQTLAQKIGQLMRNKPTLDEKILDETNLCFSILSTFKTTVMVLIYNHGGNMAATIESQINQCKQDISNVIQYKKGVCIDALESFVIDLLFDTGIQLKIFAQCLMELEMAKQLLYDESFKSELTEIVNECLKKFKQKNGNVGPLCVMLESLWPVWSQSLVSGHPIFAAQKIHRFNKSTNEHRIEYVLENIKSYAAKQEELAIDTELVGDRYAVFDRQYKQLLSENLKYPVNIDSIVAHCKLFAQKLRTNIFDTSKPKPSGLMRVWNHFVSSNDNDDNNVGYVWTVNEKADAIKLMAYVFAVWTLQNSQHYFEASKNGSYLSQPRVAQVVSILRLLSMDDTSDRKFIRHLIQIGTGEGKSLTLGVASAMLALMGFDVSCACYSEYLSTRDAKAFENLFMVLGVSDSIHYGTFEQLCERTINANGKIRSLVENLILPKKGNGNESKNDLESHNRIEKMSVLLIDEVDVFFSPNFYGQVYMPAATLKHEKISQLTDFIWQCYKKNGVIDYNEIVNSNEYAECSKLFGSWLPLLQDSVKNMLFDITTFKSTKYIVSNDQIGYKQLDRINYKISVGYSTMWLYYHQNDLKKISRESLNNNKYVRLACGVFSYAEIAKYFDVVLGVSGTIDTLSKFEKSVMETEYGIARYTIMPSLFGKNKFCFSESSDILICESSNFHENLKEEIKSKMNGNAGGARCVFVFFQSKQKLNDFYQSNEFSAMQNENSEKIFVLNEECNDQEKDNCIIRACISGRILLSTKAFGRGTDFQIKDDKVANNGGPHVISTFLSNETSEEKQIQGRTARQGGKGSFSMVLNENDLETFGISKEELANERRQNGMNKMYQFLNNKRLKTFGEKYDKMKASANNSLQHHKRAMHFLTAIVAHKHDQVMNDLEAFNPSANILAEAVKVAILMDATGSMGSLLAQAKNTVQEMFNRISNILEANGKDPKSFQLKFVAYRNYNAPCDELLEYSGWCCNAAELVTFLNQIEAKYGWGNEAMEVGLQHINDLISNQKDKIAQIIVIGDAPANTRKDVETKRKQRSEKYWQKIALFANSSHWENELVNIQRNKIKVNAFYLDKRAQNNFEKIAKRTDGQCGPLDIKSSKGAETLTNLVSQRVLDACGGGKLVKAYQDKYMHA